MRSGGESTFDPTFLNIAVGGNTEAATVSGVNVAKTIMLVYLMAGVLYGIATVKPT